MKPDDRAPVWPSHAAFLRAQYCLTYVQSFMTDAEYMTIRGRIAGWDIAHEKPTAQAVCLTADCENAAHAKGLCNRHYLQALRRLKC